jgi:hypothetical protein
VGGAPLGWAWAGGGGTAPLRLGRRPPAAAVGAGRCAAAQPAASARAAGGRGGCVAVPKHRVLGCWLTCEVAPVDGVQYKRGAG